MEEAWIVADGIEKRYGETVALDGVSLSVDAGEVFALVGPNGVGKTTLVRCLTGTTEPSGGSAALLGTSPGSVDRSRIGLLPQDFSPPDRLTARELVAYYAGLYDEARPVETVLDAVGVADSAGTRYVDLSGGQKRRTLLGTAIVNDPDVLFLDEPTTGIDPAGRRAVWSLIEDLAGTGTTVFLTSHYMEEVERLADRVGVLVDGRLVDVGTPADLLDAHGEESRLLVETDATTEGAEWGEELAGHPVVRVDRGLRVDAIEPGEIGAVVEALEAAGVAYEALAWRKSDLETVYLDLTGEAPGDGTGVLANASGGPPEAARDGDTGTVGGEPR